MSAHEDLFRLMQQYRVAKVALYPDGSIRTAIALPPAEEPVKQEPDTPAEMRKKYEDVLFAHESPPPDGFVNGAGS